MNIYYFTQCMESKIQRRLCWGVLVLRRFQSKDQLRLQLSEDLSGGWRRCFQDGLLTWLANWFLLIGGGLNFLTGKLLNRVASVSSQDGNWLHPEQVIKERSKQKLQCILWPGFGSHKLFISIVSTRPGTGIYSQDSVKCVSLNVNISLNFILFGALLALL